MLKMGLEGGEDGEARVGVMPPHHFNELEVIVGEELLKEGVVEVAELKPRHVAVAKLHFKEDDAALVREDKEGVRGAPVGLARMSVAKPRRGEMVEGKKGVK